MRLTRYIGLLAASCVIAGATGSSAWAKPIAGTVAINVAPGGSITTNSGSNLSTATKITFNAATKGNYKGDSAYVTAATSNFTNYDLSGDSELGDIITVSQLDLTNLSSFTFKDPKSGMTFTAAPSVTYLNQTLSSAIVNQSATFLDIVLYGTVSGLTAWDPTTVSVTINLNVAGSSIAGSLSIATLPVVVPEPATLALFGAGLAAVGVARRRRKPVVSHG